MKSTNKQLHVIPGYISYFGERKERQSRVKVVNLFLIIYKFQNKLARLAKMANQKREISKRKWGTLIEAARNAGMARIIGRSRSEDSVCSNCSHSSSAIRKLRQTTTDQRYLIKIEQSKVDL